MNNKYLTYISDEHFLNCIANLHKSYLKAKNKVTKKSFYNNKIDTIKLTFDSKFNDIGEESLIQTEILRQIDKSINNSIGTFHEQILGGVEGFEVGKLSDFDIKAMDNSLFAVFGQNDLSQNISEAVFEKLANATRIFLTAKFYYVLLEDYSETNEKWLIGHDEYSVSQKRVFKISLTQFYAEITKQKNAYKQLCEKLPLAVEAYFATRQPS